MFLGVRDSGTEGSLGVALLSVGAQLRQGNTMDKLRASEDGSEGHVYRRCICATIWWKQYFPQPIHAIHRLLNLNLHQREALKTASDQEVEATRISVQVVS